MRGRSEEGRLLLLLLSLLLLQPSQRSTELEPVHLCSRCGLRLLVSLCLLQLPLRSSALPMRWTSGVVHCVALRGDLRRRSQERRSKVGCTRGAQRWTRSRRTRSVQCNLREPLYGAVPTAGEGNAKPKCRQSNLDFDFEINMGTEDVSYLTMPPAVFQLYHTVILNEKLLQPQE